MRFRFLKRCLQTGGQFQKLRDLELEGDFFVMVLEGHFFRL